MNKKFLSAILFGALMVTSTGTFVSCKDYDDDIDNINKELTDIKSQIAALQTKVDAGKYVTGVDKTDNGITIKLSDGTSYPITNGATGAAGADGDKVEISADGFFIINGEPTEWKAIAKDATGQTIKIKTPTVSEDGCWVFYNEKGEAQITTIKVAPVTAIQNADKSWTLTVFDKDGKSQEITVPTAASSLTDLMLITRTNGTETDQPLATLSIAEYNFVYSGTGAPARDKWAGQKALPKNGYILAGTSSLKIQVNPTGIDAADLSLKLIDSKNNYVSNVDLATTPYTDLEYLGSRAANANGLYTLAVADKYFEKVADKNNYWTQFSVAIGSGSNAKAYAVTAGGDVRSKYEVKVSTGTAETLTHVYLVNTETDAPLKCDNATAGSTYKLAKNATTTGSAADVDGKMEANVWYKVVADNADALYDMHLVYSDDDKILFGIETKEEDGIVAIRLTKTPDNITKAGFLLTIQNVDKNGAYNAAKVWLGETSVITNTVVYDAITHQLSKNNADTSKDKNFFQIDLAKMKEALGTNGLALWNTKVKGMTVAYYNADGDKLQETDQVDEFFVSELKANLKDNKAKDIAIGKDAKNMIFEVANSKAAALNFEIGKQYTAVITFMDAATGGEELNSIKLPFTFTLPAITDLFVIDSGFKEGEIAKCYLYADDFKAVETTGAATFKLSRIFSKYDANGFTIALNSKDKIGSTDKKSSELAELKTATVTADVLSYLSLSGDLGKEKGYDQVLKLTISGKFDNAWEYPADAVFNFQAKIMSPIEKGKIVPKANNIVTIKASDLDGYKFGNDVITGYTYNSEVTYKVMPDKIGNPTTTATWTRNDIKEVKGETGNKLYFDVDNAGKPTVATEETDKDGKKTTVEGALVLKGYQVDHTVDTTIKIKVTDIWNRVRSSDVPVKITVGE